MKLRNELQNDRLLLLKVLPTISHCIAQQFVMEGWGCLFLKNTLWNRISKVFQLNSTQSISSFTSIITLSSMIPS